MLARASLLAAMLTLPLSAAASPPSVADYLADGYTIAEKRAIVEVVKGAPPYSDLPRRIQRTTYRLVKPGSASIACTLSYDSQQDTMTTACHPLKPAR